jgi:hypothetical protein
MFSISDEELAKKPLLGETIHCKKCGKDHPIECGEKTLPNGDKVGDNLLAFYRCSGKVFLAGIGGKAI